MLSSMQEFFFLQKVSKMFSQCKSFTKEKVFLCSMQVARLLSQPWAICQGSRNRSQNRSWNFFLSCFWANEWPEKKKSFFFVKVRPRRVFHKNSGARTCLRTRPKCSQSEQTLKKRSPFVYHTQRKHGKLSKKLLACNSKSILFINFAILYDLYFSLWYILSEFF